MLSWDDELSQSPISSRCSASKRCGAYGRRRPPAASPNGTPASCSPGLPPLLVLRTVPKGIRAIPATFDDVAVKRAARRSSSSPSSSESEESASSSSRAPFVISRYLVPPAAPLQRRASANASDNPRGRHPSFLGIWCPQQLHTNGAQASTPGATAFTVAQHDAWGRAVDRSAGAARRRTRRTRRPRRCSCTGRASSSSGRSRIR